MTKEQVKAILDRVLTWPQERQEDVAGMLTAIEQQDRSRVQLSDEQLAEVERRREEHRPETLTLEEFDERLKRFDV